MTAHTLFDRPEPDHLDLALEHGREYVAIGPADGSKLGPPARVLVTGRTDRGYTIKSLTPRPTANVIAFGAEHLWRPA